MPPSSSRTPSSLVPTDINVKDEEGQPFHNDDDLTLPLFLDTLERWLSDTHADIFSYLENGYTIYRSQILVWSTEHAQALVAHAGDHSMHSFAKPSVFRPATATAMPDPLKERYRVAREELRAIAKRLESTVAARLTRSAADREKKLSKGDGGKIIQSMHARM